jgi:hypothetical protein
MRVNPVRKGGALNFTLNKRNEHFFLHPSHKWWDFLRGKLKTGKNGSITETLRI